MPTLTLYPGVYSRSLNTSDGSTGLTLNNGTPSPLTLSDASGVLALAFTPTATSGSFSVTAGVLTATGATVRLKAVVNDGIDTSAPYTLRVFARRKPGTTAAIAAQLITIKDSTGTIKLAEVYLSSALANAEPVSDFIDVPRANGDTRWSLSTGQNLLFTVTSVDASVEVVVELVGAY